MIEELIEMGVTEQEADFYVGNRAMNESGAIKMKKEMTISVLKKKLADMERKELENIICSLYKNCDYAEQAINLKVLDKSYGERLLRQYQDRMYKIFFPNDIMRTGFSLSCAKGVISDFKKVCQDTQLITVLKLCFAEYGTEFTNMFGDIDECFYNAVCSAFHDVVEAVTKDRELFDKWNSKLRELVYDSDGSGWGFHDYLEEEYNGIPWVEEEES